MFCQVWNWKISQAPDCKNVQLTSLSADSYFIALMLDLIHLFDKDPIAQWSIVSGTN